MFEIKMYYLSLVFYYYVYSTLLKSSPLLLSLWAMYQKWPIKSGFDRDRWRPPIWRPIVFLTVTFDKRKKVRLKIQHPISIKNVLSVDVMNMFLLCYIQWQTHLYIHLYLLTVFPRSANILFIKWSFDPRRNWQRRYRPLSYENKHDCQRASILENTVRCH